MCGWESSKDEEERDWWVRGSSQQFTEEGAKAPPDDYHNDVGGKDWLVR